MPGLLEEVGGDRAQDALHHSEVLLAVVGLKRTNDQSETQKQRRQGRVIQVYVRSTAPYLEQRGAQVILHQDAPDAPHVTGMVPAQIWKAIATTKSTSLEGFINLHFIQ